MMKLLWCCFLAACVTTASAAAAVDVEKTVKQVQNILQANSELPRLSRDEIIQLLNDIRAEDAKSKSSTESQERVSTTTKAYSVEDNEISPITKVPHIKDNIAIEKDPIVATSAPVIAVESTTKKGEPTVMVVLPYTPRDGSSLQELYTRPPRTEVLPESKVTPKPIKKINSHKKLQQTLENNAKLANKQKLDIPAELQAFLDAHGLKGKPGQDNFLLPLEGFKPLPPAKVIDGTVQLPENILLSYDLVPANSDENPIFNDGYPLSPNNYPFEPLKPELPFELDTSSSEKKKTILPYELPNSRKTKSVEKQPNYEPIDYDAVKVIPLQNGINPIDTDKVSIINDPNKRQTNETNDSSITSTTTTEVPTTTISDNNITITSDSKNAATDAPADSASADSDADSGASIADLEDSFGGAAPEKPGDATIPPPRRNGFYWMLDWNSFLEVGDGDTKVNIRLEPKLGDPQMFLPVSVP